jgi:peptide/nickel transport system substrate-binding protein
VSFGTGSRVGAAFDPVSRRRFLGGVGGVGIAAFLAACGQAAGTGSGAPSASKISSIVWGKPADLTEYDPQTSPNGYSWQIMFLVYEQLVNMNDKLEVIPGLAESWDVASPTEYIFTLRKGPAFSNGRVVTTADVVGSFERLLDKSLGASWTGQLGPVKAVEAIGNSQVKFTLSSPYTAFLPALAHISTSVLPIQELNAKTFDPTKELLGSGPYKVVSHSANQSWTFTANDHYWQAGQPAIKQVQIQIIPDVSSQVAALRAGTINVANFESPDAPTLLKAVPNVKVVLQESTDYYRIDVNEKGTSKLKDQRVRRALNIAIDRQELADEALAGLGKPTAATPPGFTDSVTPAELSTASLTLDDARALVKSAGADGLQFELIASTAYPEFATMAQVLQSQWKQIGLNAQISQLDAGEWEQKAFTDDPGQFDAALSYFAGYGDPGLLLEWWNPVPSVWDKGFLNSNEEINKLITETEQLPTGSARKSALLEASNLISIDSGIIPLVTRVYIVAYRADEINAAVGTTEGYEDILRGAAGWSARG